MHTQLTNDLQLDPPRADPFTRILVTGNNEEWTEFELLTFLWLNVCSVRGNPDKTTVFCTVANEDLARVLTYGRKASVTIQQRIPDENMPEGDQATPADYWPVVVEGCRGQTWTGEESGPGW